MNKYYFSDGTTSNSHEDDRIIHREDGPAIEFVTGTNIWCMNGKCHRINGPAIVYSNKTELWFIDGTEYGENRYWEIINQVKALPDVLKLTDPRWWVREMVTIGVRNG